VSVSAPDLETLVRRAVERAMAQRGWQGVASRVGPAAHDHHGVPDRAGAEQPRTDPMHEHGRQSGSDFCIQCGGCMEPAVYDREKRTPPASTREVIDRLDRFTELAWRAEPQDLQRLRQLSRPPMGRTPGVLYANFNLFWLGESLQTLRDKARAGTIPIEALNEMLAAACLRSAIRLSKWKLLDVIFLLSDVVGFAQRTGCRDHAEMKQLIEHLLLAVDRVQAWVDRMIPWHRMDAVLELVP
jgi:hypothetical protein